MWWSLSVSNGTFSHSNWIYFSLIHLFRYFSIEYEKICFFSGWFLWQNIFFSQSVHFKWISRIVRKSVRIKSYFFIIVDSSFVSFESSFLYPTITELHYNNSKTALFNEMIWSNKVTSMRCVFLHTFFYAQRMFTHHITEYLIFISHTYIIHWGENIEHKE